MVGDELKEPQNSYGMNVYDLMNYHGLSTSAKLVEQVVEALQREIRKLKKDKADLCKMWGLTLARNAGRLCRSVLSRKSTSRLTAS